MPKSLDKKSNTSKKTATARKNARALDVASRHVDGSPVVLGLDLSIAGTGAVLLKGSAVVWYRWLRTQTNERGGKVPSPSQIMPSGHYRGSQEQRIYWITCRLQDLLKEEPIDLVVIEGHAFGMKNSSSASILHELHGVVKNMCLRFRLPYVIVAPPTLKKYATGDSRAEKTDMIFSAKKHWPEVYCDDLADGFWLAHWGIKELSRIIST